MVLLILIGLNIKRIFHVSMLIGKSFIILYSNNYTIVSGSFFVLSYQLRNKFRAIDGNFNQIKPFELFLCIFIFGCISVCYLKELCLLHESASKSLLSSWSELLHELEEDAELFASAFIGVFDILFLVDEMPSLA